MKYEGLKISKESIDKLFPKMDIDILGYESPIHMITDQLATETAKRADENIWEAVVKTGVVVDKEELIKAMQYDRDQYDKGYINGYNAGFTADKWISVEERLPDPNEYDWVLGAVKTTELPEGSNWYLPPHVVELRNGKWWALGEDYFSLSQLHCTVTHWMPLPEPPKESEDTE